VKITRSHLRKIIKEELSRTLILEQPAVTPEQQAFVADLRAPRTLEAGPRWQAKQGDVAVKVEDDTGSFRDTLRVAQLAGGEYGPLPHDTVYDIRFELDDYDEITFSLTFSGLEENRRVTSALEGALRNIIDVWPDDGATLKAVVPIDYGLPEFPTDKMELIS